MERLAIVADNLIGANDAGVQFSKFGFSTQVILDHGDLGSYGHGADVIAVNTDSRSVAPETAYERACQVGSMLLQRGIRRFYKKIDSTLRGNIAEEVRAMMEVLSLDLAVIVPAYPAHGRIVENGYLQMLQNWGDSRVPVPICYIPSIVKPVALAPVAVVGLEAVRQGDKKLAEKILELYNGGAKVVAIDAVTDEDLRQIALAICSLKIGCLPVGSAGLAGSLSIAWKMIDKGRIGLRQGTLLIAGTLNQVTAEQITSALEYPMTDLIEIQADKIYDGKADEEYRRVMARVGASLTSGSIPVVVTDTLLKDRNDATALSFSVHVQKYGGIVTALLGRIARQSAEQYGLRNLIISGGGTATIICHTLAITTIELERELLPGIPVGSVREGGCGGLHLITKAGGFGRRNALRKVLELL